jgi:hypothetical protein
MDGSLDKQRCNRRLLGLAKLYGSESVADACGKCAIGPCSFESAVHDRGDAATRSTKEMGT